MRAFKIPILMAGAFFAGSLALAFFATKNALSFQKQIVTGTAVVERKPEETTTLYFKFSKKPEKYYEATLARPLFEPSRRPVEITPSFEQIEAPEVKVAPQPEQSSSELRLLGIMKRNSASFALLTDGVSDPAWIELDASYKGWKVTDFGNDWVNIEAVGTQQKLEIYK